jgi:hypothetical protein
MSEALKMNMSKTRKIIPVIGLCATLAIAGYMVVRLSGQGAAPTGDFRNAAMAEVRDQPGQVVLRGQFRIAEEEDDDVERKATLEPTGVDPDAAGEAEVEYTNDAQAEQEVEFAANNLTPGGTVTFVIDGTDIATVTVDSQGRAKAELDIRAVR